MILTILIALIILLIASSKKIKNKNRKIENIKITLKGLFLVLDT